MFNFYSMNKYTPTRRINKVIQKPIKKKNPALTIYLYINRFG